MQGERQEYEKARFDLRSIPSCLEGKNRIPMEMRQQKVPKFSGQRATAEVALLEPCEVLLAWFEVKDL